MHRYADDFIRKPLSMIKGTDVRSQLINECRAADMAQGLAGLPQGQRYSLPVGEHQLAADTLIEKYLNRPVQQVTGIVQDRAATPQGQPHSLPASPQSTAGATTDKHLARLVQLGEEAARHRNTAEPRSRPLVVVPPGPAPRQ